MEKEKQRMEKVNPMEVEYLKVGESKVVNGQVIFKPDQYDDGLAFENIHILDTDKTTWIPFKVVESSSILNLEETEITKPSSFSCSIQMKPNKAIRKWYRDQTRTIPDRAKPHKKRSWRLVRKWFNRYQRPRWKGMRYRIETSAGYIDAIILDVTIHRDHDNNVYHQYKSKPIFQ